MQRLKKPVCRQMFYLLGENDMLERIACRLNNILLKAFSRDEPKGFGITRRGIFLFSAFPLRDHEHYKDNGRLRRVNNLDIRRLIIHNSFRPQRPYLQTANAALKLLSF